MTRHRAHEHVEPGIYFNLRKVAFASMEDDGRLPGTDGDVYHRVPAVAMLVVGPLVGLAYFVFLPLVGFAMLGALIARKAWELTRDLVRAGTRSLAPAWQPARAFFTLGRRTRTADRPADDAWATAVARELGREPEAPGSPYRAVHLEKRIHIDSPVEEVYEVLHDAAHCDAWYHRYSRPRRIAEKGARGRGLLLLGRDFPLEQDVLEDRRDATGASWRTRAGHPATGALLGSDGILVNLPCDEEWHCEPADGGTDVTVAVDVAVPDLALAAAVAGVTLAEMEEECLEDSLKELKELCEEGVVH